MGKNNGHGFRAAEKVVLSHYDKRNNQWIETEYPKVGGRLRLAHEDNEQLSLTADIVQYDGQTAVVRALASTRKGDFSGLGMASVERDARIAPAILELAETRAIARCLRFAGYGVEYCGAEEVSHLSNHRRDEQNEEPAPKGNNGGNGGNGRGDGQANGRGNGGSNGDGRITNRQLSYIVQLGKGLGLDSKALDAEAVSAYGLKLAHLKPKDASSFIDALKTRDQVPF